MENEERSENVRLGQAHDTHESKTDPDAKLYRKGNGQEARLGYLGHVMMENRNGLIVDAMVTQADGTAERDAGLMNGCNGRRFSSPTRPSETLAPGSLRGPP